MAKNPQKQDENRVKRDSKGQFVKGQSGNPGGRPHGSVGLTNRVKDVLLQERNGRIVADALAEVLIKEALKNPSKMWSFIKEFMDRDEGRSDGRGEIEAETTAEQRATEIMATIQAMKDTVPNNE